MGAVPRTPQPQVNDRDLLDDIVEEAGRISSYAPAARWYGFGSYFRGQASFHHIDVLVVCPSHDDAVVLRRESEAVCSRWPLDLLIMTDDEVAETAFIQSQNCVMIHAGVPTDNLSLTETN